MEFSGQGVRPLQPTGLMRLSQLKLLLFPAKAHAHLQQHNAPGLLKAKPTHREAALGAAGSGGMTIAIDIGLGDVAQIFLHVSAERCIGHQVSNLQQLVTGMSHGDDAFAAVLHLPKHNQRRGAGCSHL